MKQCLEGRTASWRQLLTTTKQHLLSAESTVSRVSGLRITGLPERDRMQIRTEAETLQEHLQSGGSLGFWIFRPKAIRPSLYLATNVRVDGRLCNSSRQLKVLIDWIDVSEAVYLLRKAWTSRAKVVAGSLAEQIAYFTDLRSLVERVVGLNDIVESLNAQIAASPELDPPAWHDAASLGDFRDSVSWAHLSQDLVNAKGFFDALERELAPLAAQSAAHPLAKRLLADAQDRETQRYREGHAQLMRYSALLQDLHRRDELLAQLRANAAALEKQLYATASEPAWDERLANFTGAWNWASADAWLSRLNDPESLQRLSNQLDEYRKAIRSLLAELAAEKAWAHCFARMTEHERQHLEAWEDGDGVASERGQGSMPRGTVAQPASTWRNAGLPSLPGSCPSIV